MTHDVARLAGAAATAAAYTAFCGWTIWRVRARQRRAATAAVSEGPAPVLVAFASQTGFAEHLAGQTAEALRAAGTPVRVLPLGEVDTPVLAAAGRALFIAATTGKGDAPDPAARFVGRVMAAEPTLPQLEYGLLALGDSEYREFCAFGRRLDGWLRHRGARPLFDLTEVDNGDEAALRHWQTCLGSLTGHAELPDWGRPAYERWTLAERRLLNPGSLGGPAFHLALRPLDGMAMAWQAGDIAEIGPRNPPVAIAEFLARLGHAAEADLVAALADRLLPLDIETLRATPAADLPAVLQPLPHREYSIASLPRDGALDLLVRRMAHPDGRLGLGSGWLTAHAPLGGEIALRVRTNRNFHAPADDRPMLLIGNGTGLAGMRAHLRARAAAGRRRNWLLFGERSAAHDFFHRDEIEGWRTSGVLERLDLAFSRDQAERRYVQHLLRDAADAVQQWIADGAAIYVCGSLEGMAGGVDAALADILGRNALASLAEDGRYRRDVY